MASPKIVSTRNYRMFRRSDDNRIVDLKQHKNLRDSMKKYGFLSSFPIVCHRNGDGGLVVDDGQHRLAIAEELGLPVHYVAEQAQFDIALINSTAKVWTIGDYAAKYAANGIDSYIEGLQFAEQYGIPVGNAFALLAGTVSVNNVIEDYRGGTFQVKEREHAHMVAGLYSRLAELSPCMKTNQCVYACISVCRVEGFEPDRLITSASRNREKLVKYATKDGFLELFDELYNFKYSKKVPLKFMAMEAMKARNAITVKSTQKANRELAAAAKAV